MLTSIIWSTARLWGICYIFITRALDLLSLMFWSCCQLTSSTDSSEHCGAWLGVYLQYHPDVCEGEHCDLVFKQVNNAYKV